MVNVKNSEAFCLKMNCHQNRITETFQRLYREESMVDCTISCAGGTLKAHKLILSAYSPYFSSLFSTFTNPYQYPVVVIKDMPFLDLKAIIEFMYKGEVTVPRNILPSVLDSAKTLSVTGLMRNSNVEFGPPTSNQTIRFHGVGSVNNAKELIQISLLRKNNLRTQALNPQKRIRKNVPTGKLKTP